MNISTWSIQLSCIFLLFPIYHHVGKRVPSVAGQGRGTRDGRLMQIIIDLIYPSGKQTGQLSEMAIEIVDLPMKNGDYP